jgi:hypothetical protein
LQNPIQINGDNFQNFRRNASRTFRKNKREYLKGKINELEINNKRHIRDVYRGINDFWKSYQTRIDIIKDGNGNLLADPYGVLNRWKNSFNQVLNVHGIHDVKQTDKHTAEPLVSEPGNVKVEIAIGKLKSYKSPGSDQIPAELIKAGVEILRSDIHKRIRFIWNEEKLPHYSGKVNFICQ